MCVPCGSEEACLRSSGRGVDFRFLFAYCRKSGKGVTFMDRTEVYPAPPTLPWRLPRRGLVLFEGDSDVPRLSHYFLPRLVLGGQKILFLDGAHCPDCPRIHLLSTNGIDSAGSRIYGSIPGAGFDGHRISGSLLRPGHWRGGGAGSL